MSRTDSQVNFRVPLALLRVMRVSAKVNNRSVTAELNAALNAWADRIRKTAQPSLDRTEIAAMAMQGLLANPYYAQQGDDTGRSGSAATAAVFHADELLAELAKEQKP